MTMMGEPAEVELAAEKWHDEQTGQPSHADEMSECWCCCDACDIHSPYYDEAQVAMWAAIKARDGGTP